MVGRLALLSVMMLAGCGSAMNVIDAENYSAPKMVYGGARLDAEMIDHGVHHAVSLEPEKSVNPYPRLDAAMLATSGLLDLPFAVVADTVTLPITGYAAYLRWQETLKPPEKKRPSSDEQIQERVERMPGVDLPARTSER